jgi:hypothetical protein
VLVVASENDARIVITDPSPVYEPRLLDPPAGDAEDSVQYVSPRQKKVPVCVIVSGIGSLVWSIGRTVFMFAVTFQVRELLDSSAHISISYLSGT